MTISGIVNKETIVLRDTILAESGVFLSNFAENIVVIAAVGALTDITEETKSVPLIPQRYIAPKIISGKTTNFKSIE